MSYITTNAKHIYRKREKESEEEKCIIRMESEMRTDQSEEVSPHNNTNVYQTLLSTKEYT